MNERIASAIRWRDSRCDYTMSTYPHRQCIAGKDHPEGKHRDLSGYFDEDDTQEEE